MQFSRSSARPSTHPFAQRVRAKAVFATLLVTASAWLAAATATAASSMTAMRRLTETQYRSSIADVFGADITINGRFEPEQREELLLAIGSSMLSISARGFDQYFAMGRSIADQALDEKRRAKVVGCVPANAAKPDAACTKAFVSKYGRLLFRRPLTATEIAQRVQLAEAGAAQKQDYYAGLKLALISLLSAPEFLFRVEVVEPDPAKRTAQRLDGYSKASRLSFLLWDTTPDAALLEAAAKGELHTQAGLRRQVDRLLASPRVEAGTRAFFSDMLQLDLYESLTKDPMIFPKFSQAVADSAKEQTLMTVVDLLLTNDGDYRDLFTTRVAYINRSLASIYQIPFVGPADGWVRHEFPPESDQSGLLTQLSFLGLFSHPGRSSPTKRGVAINEVLMCKPSPLPPANVDFSIVNDVNNPNLKTVRNRLLAHSEDEVCAGCHMKSDPLGLALERFDSLGQRRDLENGALIDVSAALDGRQFEGARGLGAAVHDNPKVPACLVRNVYAYGVGRKPEKAEEAFLDAQSKTFAQQGYRLRNLFEQIVGSAEFFSFKPAATPDTKVPTAANSGAASP